MVVCIKVGVGLRDEMMSSALSSIGYLPSSFVLLHELKKGCNLPSEPAKLSEDGTTSYLQWLWNVLEFMLYKLNLKL